jgi:hypothetical protein
VPHEAWRVMRPGSTVLCQGMQRRVGGMGHTVQTNVLHAQEELV